MFLLSSIQELDAVPLDYFVISVRRNVNELKCFGKDNDEQYILNFWNNSYTTLGKNTISQIQSLIVKSSCFLPMILGRNLI